MSNSHAFVCFSRKNWEYPLVLLELFKSHSHTMGSFMIGDPCLWNLTWGGVSPEPVSTFSANGVPWKHQSRDRQAQPVGGAWWRSWRLAPKWGKSQIAWCCIESYHKVWWMSTMMAVLRLRKPPPLLRQCARVLLEKLLHWRLKFGESFVREVYSVVRFLSTVVLYKVTYVNLSMFGLERLPRHI